MSGFTKLFSTIITSTVWQEPGPTRLVWITMLASTDQRGRVLASIPGLAHVAGVTIQECEAALLTFLSPDPYSRTKDREGRRIEEIDGGWLIINHAKYRAMLSEESIRASKRAYMQRVREEAKNVEKVEQSGKSGQLSIQAEAEADTSRSKTLVRQAARFDEFWGAYPTRVARKTCLEKWKARGLDKHADAILADIAKRKAEDERWLKGFVPNPATYLNQDRWTDEIVKAPPVAGGKFQGKPKASEETPLERALAHLRHQRSLGAYTEDQYQAAVQAATEKHRATP